MVRETPTKSEIDNLLVQATKKVKDAKASGIEIRQPKALIERIVKREKEEKLAEKDKTKKLSKEDKAIKKAKDALKKAQEKNDPKAIDKAKANLKKAQEAKRKKDKMGLDKLTKKMFETEKNLEKAGAKKKEAPKKEKDDKSKEKDKDKEKNNDKGSKEVAQKKAAMQKKYDNINLPGGLTITQEGKDWVLVDPNTKRRKTVTDEMNKLIEINQNIDLANRKIDKNNQEISASQVGNAVKTDDLQPRDKSKTNEMIDNSVAGISTGQMKVADPVKGVADIPTAVPEVKITNFDGKDLNPATAKGLAIVAVANAFDQNDLNKIEKKLQEKLEEKDKKQKQEHEASIRQVPQKGGRE